MVFLWFSYGSRSLRGGGSELLGAPGRAGRGARPWAGAEGDRMGVSRDGEAP